MIEGQDDATIPLRERAIAIAVLVACVAFLLAMAAGYAWIARRSLAATTIIGGLIGLFSIGMFGIFTQRRVKIDSVPEPLNSEILAVLAEDGQRKTVVRRGTGGVAGIFPRPIVNVSTIIVPDRVLRDWSSEAILWSIRTDHASGRRFARRSGPAVVAAMIAVLFAMALLDRWHLATGGYLSIPFVAILGVLTLACLDLYRYERAEDRRITQTPEDLAFAREALLYPYVAQRERSLVNKWMFFSRELRGRARRLGIDLDAEVTKIEDQAAKRA